MKLLSVLACALIACTPPATPPADAAPPATVQTDASAVDPVTLRICLDNFEELNPCRPGISCPSEAEIQSVFCNTPDDLAPWDRQRILNGSR